MNIFYRAPFKTLFRVQIKQACVTQKKQSQPNQGPSLLNYGQKKFIFSNETFTFDWINSISRRHTKSFFTILTKSKLNNFAANIFFIFLSHCTVYNLHMEECLRYHYHDSVLCALEDMVIQLMEFSAEKLYYDESFDIFNVDLKWIMDQKIHKMNIVMSRVFQERKNEKNKKLQSLKTN